MTWGLSLRISAQEKRVIDEWNIVDYYNNDYEKMLKCETLHVKGVCISVSIIISDKVEKAPHPYLIPYTHGYLLQVFKIHA